METAKRATVGISKSTVGFVNVFFLAVVMSVLSLPLVSTVHAEQHSSRSHSGFSGLPYFVPRSSRLTLYKYRAMTSKEEGQMHDKEGLQHFSDPFSDGVIVPGSAVSDCSINIGNIFSDGTTGNFGDKENVVIIDGDVVNAGNCR